MTWFKVDDRLWSHPKWIGLPAEAKALWVSAGAYCAQHESDGFISRVSCALVMPNSRVTRAINALIESGFWVRVDGGFKFHDWEDYQPTRNQLSAKRQADRERKAEWRERKSREVSQRDTQRTDGVTRNGVRSTRPDPTRPDHINTPYSPPKGDTENTPPDVANMFNKFWDVFPKERKRAKSKCLELFKKLAKAGQNLEAIVTAAEQYRDDPNREPLYTVNPYTWLREERWEAGPLPGNGPTGSRVDEWIQAGRDVQAQLRQVGS